MYTQYPGFTDSSVGKESACYVGDPGSIPGSGISPGKVTGYSLQYSWAFLVAHLVKNPPIMLEIWLQSLGWDDSPEKRKATHFNIQELDMTEWLSRNFPSCKILTISETACPSTRFMKDRFVHSSRTFWSKDISRQNLPHPWKAVLKYLNLPSRQRTMNKCKTFQ